MVSWWKASLASDSFSNTTYAEKLTLDFTAPAQGDYIVIFTAHVRSETTNYSVGCRLQLDDSTTILETLAEPNSTVEDDVIPISTFYLAEDLSVGSHYIDLDCLVESATGYINDVKIVVLRLDDWLPTTGMYDSVATESSSDLTASFATYETLTFTPDQAGEYLVLGTARFASNTGQEVAVLRLNYDSGSEYLPIVSPAQAGTYFGRESKETDDLYQNFWGGIITIPASSKTILLEARAETTATGTIHYRRIIAIRLGAMDSGYESDEDTTETTASTTTWVDKTSIDFTPSSAGDYLILGSIVGYNASSYSCFRVNHTAGTGTGTLQSLDPLFIKEQLQVSDSLSCSAFDIKSLGATQQIFKTEHREWTASSSNNRARGSFIVAIRLPDPPDADPWVGGTLDSEISFINTTYNEKFTLEFTAPASGDYLIIISGKYSGTDGFYDGYLRAQLDDTTTFLEYFRTFYEGADHPFGAFYLAESLAAGAHHIDLDAYVGSGATGYLEHINIIVVRLDAILPTPGMYAYAETDTESNLTTSWATYETLTFTPDTEGEYLILGTVQYTSTLANESANIRLNYDSALEYIPIASTKGGADSFVSRMALSSDKWQSAIWGGLVTIPASSKTILLEGMAGTTSALIKYRKIIAIRLGAIDASYESDEDVSESQTSSSSYVVKSTLPFTPASESEYLIIGNIHNGTDSFTPGEITGARVEQTVGTGIGTIVDAEWDNKGYYTPEEDSFSIFTATIKSLTGVLQTIETQHSALVSGDDSFARSSFVIAIRKPSVGGTVDFARRSEVSPLVLVSLTRRSEVFAVALELADETRRTSLMVTAGYILSGVTKDVGGSPLGSCDVYLFKDNLDNTITYKGHVVSDAVTGVYTFIDIADDDVQYMAVAFKDGTPDRMDVTDHVLQPT